MLHMRPKIGINYINKDNDIVEVWAVCTSHVVFRCDDDTPVCVTRSHFTDNFKELENVNKVKKPRLGNQIGSPDWLPPGKTV